MGSQAVEVIQQLGFASNTSEAEAFGGKLIAAKIVKHVDEQEETIKDDVFFYQFIMDLSAAPDIDTSNEQQVQWFNINPLRYRLEIGFIQHLQSGAIQNQ